MEWFISVSLVALFTLLGAGLIVLLINWASVRVGAKLKFKRFKEFYQVNPKRWDIDDVYIRCYRLDDDKKFDYFYFGLIDFVKYVMWRRKIQCSAKSKEDNAATARMLEAVKADIKASKEAEEKRILEAWRTWLRNVDTKHYDRAITKIIEDLKNLEFKMGDSNEN